MNQTLLRKNITEFFNISELKTLCYDLGVNYENIPGETLEDKARGLIEYAVRHGVLFKLLSYCQEKRPQVAWLNVFPGKLYEEPQGSKGAKSAQLDKYQELLFSVEKEELSPLGKFAKIAFQSIKNNWPWTTWSYPEFWDWLNEQEKHMGRGIVYLTESELGYISADHVIRVAGKDLAQEVLTYKLGQEYIIVAELDQNSERLQIAYRKESRIPNNL